jgi:glycerophosphoryl diester phosphodiesterase
MQELARDGVDGVITDFPALALREASALFRQPQPA